MNTISLKIKDIICSSEDRDSFDQLIKGDIDRITRIEGGANSQVYSIDCADGRKLIGKKYFQSEHDQRDRGKIEFESLSFLWKKGLRSIPQPMAVDQQCRHAVYGFIDGTKIESADIQKEEIHAAVRFLSQLKDLSQKTGRSQFSKASEACFTIKDLEDNLQTRIDRLIRVDGQGDQYTMLQQFINSDLRPFVRESIDWSVKQISDLGLTYDQEVEKGQLTLSPSDFGFHNALREKDGSVIYLDFEYFGWDDPAKMVCDFVLHPAMDMEYSLKKMFVDEIFKAFDDYTHLRARTKAMYPLYGAKWCLIFLNEFIPADFQRRHFSGISTVNKDEVLIQQLKKSKKMLSEVRNIYTSNSVIQ